jgi:hypothetical protein
MNKLDVLNQRVLDEEADLLSDGWIHMKKI